VSIPALMQQTAGRRAPYGEPTKHERVEMRSRDSGERFPVSAARTRSTRLSACDVWRRLRREKYAREALRFGEDLPSRETRLSWRRLRHDLPKTTRIGSSDHLRSKPAAWCRCGHTGVTPQPFIQVWTRFVVNEEDWKWTT